MKKLLLLLPFLLLSSVCFAQTPEPTPHAATSGILRIPELSAVPSLFQALPVRVREVDGSPNVSAVSELIFQNGTLAQSGSKITISGSGSISGPATVTDNSAACLSVGPNGTTNPVFQVVCNVASQATGLSVTGNAAGSGVTLTALSSGSNENIILTPKGTGLTQLNGTAAIGAGNTTISGNLALRVEPLWTSSPGNFDRAMFFRPSIDYNVGTNFISFQNSPSVRATRTVPTLFGVFVAPNQVTGDTGTITTFYGLYVAAKAFGTITTPYAFVSEATAGNSGFGTTAPNAPLHVVGSIIAGASGSTIGTSGTNVVALANGTPPTTSPADEVQQYAADAVAGSSEMYLRNEAGEINRLTGLASRNSAAFTATSSVTLTSITGIPRNVEAGRVYAFRGNFQTTANVAGGIQFSVSGTATATAISYEGTLQAAAALVNQTRATALDTVICASTTTTAGTCHIEGVIQVNAAGTLTIAFAQNVSNGAASTVIANQYFALTPIN